MDWVNVTSTFITTVAYESERSKLYVCFKGGSKFIYSNVPAQTYRDLLSADSQGKFFIANIKGKFNEEKAE